MYQISLSCGKKYVEQTGKCVNDRLREHNLNLNSYRDGHLSVYCQACDCRPLFSTCLVLARHKDKTVRKIIEENLTKRPGVGCVRVAFVDLIDKDGECDDRRVYISQFFMIEQLKSALSVDQSPTSSSCQALP